MKAVRVAATTGPTGVRMVQMDEPERGPDEVLIDVHVAGVCFPDLLLTRGVYQRVLPMPFTLGGEVAGVVRVAPAHARVRPGDRVAAILPDFGGFAECAVAPAEYVFPIPDGVGFDIAAGVPVNYLTMQLAFRRRTELATGDVVLVHGAAGGVGVAAIQLARAWGTHVVAVASTSDKQDVARRAGAHDVVSVEGFRDTVRRLVPRGVDVVVDPVGGDRLLDSVRCLADEGRLLVIGFASGSIPTLKVNRLLFGNVSLIGVNLGVSMDGVSVQLEDGLQRCWEDLVPLLRDSVIRPAIAHKLPLDRASEALAALEDRAALGKILLHVR